MELAIQKDCEALVEGFVLNENPRFESFVYQWKATRFQQIYAGQSFSVEIIQSTNACIHYAKRILSYRKTMPKLGALFLLYAIHFKQPTHCFHKIDIDLTAWIKFKEFIFCLDNMLNSEEAKCIFWNLLKEDSLRFVASDTYYGLENLINLDKIRNNVFNLNNTLYIFQCDMKYLTYRRGLISGITKLDDGYNEMKELMNQSSSTDNKASGITVPMSDTFEELKSALNSLNSFINNNKYCKQNQKKVKSANRNRDADGVVRRKKRCIHKAKNKTHERTKLL